MSPLHCEKIVAQLGLKAPNVDENGIPQRYKRDLPTDVYRPILDRLEEEVQAIEARYDGQILGSGTQMRFVQYFEDQKNQPELIGCENSTYQRKKWVRHSDIDLVGFIWLKDYNNSVPMDARSQVYGGKLEFPAYGCSLVPQQGTLVMYPAGPSFLTAISHVMIGSLEMIKIGLKLNQGKESWHYDKSRHPGSFPEWFL